MSILKVYAPTAQSEDTELVEFYKQIVNILQSIKSHEILTIMRAWNAKIGKRKFEELVGEFGMGEKNDRRERLV